MSGEQTPPAVASDLSARLISGQNGGSEDRTDNPDSRPRPTSARPTELAKAAYNHGCRCCADEVGVMLNGAGGLCADHADALAEAVKNVCWKATQYGEDAEGFITRYLLPAGALHRLIGAAQGAGISAAFRALDRDDAGGAT